MKVAIMQPYFFPYIGYLSLIKNTDKFILLDTVQFMRHGWIERNRVLKQNGGWLYIQVPLKKHSRTASIKEIEIDNEQPWKKKILAQLQPYKKIAPYYNNVIDMINELFNCEYSGIVDLDRASLLAIAKYLNIKADIEVFSKMGITIKEANAPDEWALNICKAMPGVNEYWNPPGGISFFDKDKYERENIQIKFQEADLKKYDQKREMFEPGLSIIDVLMFNSTESVNAMLGEFELL